MDILLEVAIIIAVGFPVTYLVWKVGGKKKNFGEFLGDYGYVIAIVSIVIISMIIFWIRS